MKPSNAALAVLLSGALLLAGGRASATPGSDGGAALLAEDYLRALMHMEAGAEAKEPRSMHGLGVLYQNGHGVKKDLSLAQKWYSAALEEALHHQSDPETQFTLGLIYHDGHGVARDFKQAYEWFEKASSQGHGDATNSMAVMQERGLGIPRNAAAARDLYSKAALQGSTRAQYQMAVMYALGQGLPKDHRKAIKWCSSA
ncbi:MAG: tetratricopeptide repeat protein, partial [Bdellovibrionota bacterium]